jgi:hypothetical protein
MFWHLIQHSTFYILHSLSFDLTPPLNSTPPPSILDKVFDEEMLNVECWM